MGSLQTHVFISWLVSLLLCLFVLYVVFVFFVLSGEPRQNQGRGLVDRKLLQAPLPPPPQSVIVLLAIPRWLFRFGSLVILDVVRCYLLFFLL